MNAPEITLIRIAASDAFIAAPLFDAYRKFYGMPSDIDIAAQFLRERLVAEESVVVLASVSKEHVGFAQLFRSFSSVHACRVLILNDLFVAPAARRRGVASALLRYAETLALQCGIHRLVLETTRANVNAQALYARAGWLLDTNAVLFHRELPKP